MERTRRDTLLGLVFFGTLAFLLWATVNLTDISLGAVPPLVVYFPDAGSAEVGTNVMVLGKKVGKVGAIDVLYERAELPVRMKLLLKEKVPFTDLGTIELRDSGMLGGKQVYIDPGRGTEVATDTTELRGRTQKGAFDRIGDIADARGEIGEGLKDTLTAIRLFFEDMRSEESTVGRLVRRRDLYDELHQAAIKVNAILESVQMGHGTIGRLISDTQMRDDVLKIASNLAGVSDSLRGTEGTYGLLLNDKGMAENLRTLVDNVANLISDTHEGKGVLGRMFRDEKLATDFASAAANLNILLERSNDPEAGTIGLLTSDKETAAHVKATFANMRDITDALTQSEGMLGALLNDKDLAVRFRRIMNQVSRAIEDAREAAPIGNFVQVLWGAF
ncbi:MAG TPA: MlaD family protein [Planctomycetota bacterium]